MNEFARSDFEIVTIADLPAPHGMGRCYRWEKYGHAAAEFAALQGSGLPNGPGEAFLKMFTNQVCEHPAHAVDWRRVSEFAIKYFQDAETNWSSDSARIAAGTAGLSDSESEWLCNSLFVEPITWFAGDSTLDDGQHRRCAMTLGGVERTLVFRPRRSP